jgi:hypothetical protein
MCCAGLATASAVSQQRRPPRLDPSAQLLQYYRQFPERYIRITDSKWEHSAASHEASHSLSLLNTATVSYCALELRITYQTEKGTSLCTRSLKLPGTLAPFKKTALKYLTVKNVQGSPDSAVVEIAKAVVCP